MDISKVISLEPDLILANKEENRKEDIEVLMQLYPTWVSDIYTLEDACRMVREIGRITVKDSLAIAMVDDIVSSFSALSGGARFPGLKVAYLIWRNPYMVAARHTFIDHILQRAGFENAFNLGRYPIMDVAGIREADPDVIFLSSEPYPFKEKHLNEFRLICPRAQVILVDGEMFSWYGSRLKYAAAYLKNLILQNF